jgi:GNAT superfamily N-acetyltransferase
MPSTPPTLRPATPADALAIARVHVRAWQEGYRGLMSDDYLNALRPEDRAGQYTLGSSDPNAPFTIVAEVEGVVRGFATIGASEGGESGLGQLLALHVDPSAWSTGTGRVLIERARAELLARGFSEAILWVLVGNERAQRFYRIDGWRPDDVTCVDEIWGTNITHTRFRRALP